MPPMKSVMSHQFSMVPSANIPRSTFDRTHGHKTTFNPGLLIPIFVDEALPGDTFHMNMTGFARMSTPLKPIMDNSYFSTFFFAVPNRLLWDHWEEFNGQQENPGDSTDFVIPQIVPFDPANGFASYGLHDYMGVPPNVPGIQVSALPSRAFKLIWNEWFRDQNLQSSLPIDTGDGPDTEVASQFGGGLQRRGKRHDYFTSCLPWPQKGESVAIPLGTGAPVGFPFNVNEWTTSPNEGQGTFSATGTNSAGNLIAPDVANQANVYLDLNGSEAFADLSNATAATINQLRQAFQVQKLYERDARGGTRYTEIVRSHFGVVSPDARLQRPEYLGGGRSPVTIHQVAQTAPPASEDDTPQGNLAAYGTSVMRGHGFSKSFTEHCVVIGLLCVDADLTYQQGINRMWQRSTRFDFYWPALSHIGEQTVFNAEIYATGTLSDLAAFGYQERFAEYRYKPSIITGQMRSSDPLSLDVWHLSQDFAQAPNLNGEFIQSNPPFARVVAVPSEPIFIGDFYFQYRCARPMPVYGVPGMIDHF